MCIRCTCIRTRIHTWCVCTYMNVCAHMCPSVEENETSGNVDSWKVTASVTKTSLHQKVFREQLSPWASTSDLPSPWWQGDWCGFLSLETTGLLLLSQKTLRHHCSGDPPWLRWAEQCPHPWLQEWSPKVAGIWIPLGDSSLALDFFYSNAREQSLGRTL
jgi:hypothetical protein